MDKELSAAEQQILQYIYRPFKEQGCWVKSRHLVHDLHELGDAYKIAQGIGGHLVRVEDPDRDKEALARLTIEGVAVCEGSEQDLEDFVSVTQLFVQTYLETRDGLPEITTDDFVCKLDLSELQARKMEMLVLESSGLYGGASHGGEGPARFRVKREILDFGNVKSFEGYLEIREQERAQRPTPSSTGPAVESSAPDFI